MRRRLIQITAFLSQQERNEKTDVVVLRDDPGLALERAEIAQDSMLRRLGTAR